MKTTLEIPDSLFREAKSKAAERGQTLKQLVTEALQEKLAVTTGEKGNRRRPRDADPRPTLRALWAGMMDTSSAGIVSLYPSSSLLVCAATTCQPPSRFIHTLVVRKRLVMASVSGTRKLTVNR